MTLRIIIIRELKWIYKFLWCVIHSELIILDDELLASWE